MHRHAMVPLLRGELDGDREPPEAREPLVEDPVLAAAVGEAEGAEELGQAAEADLGAAVGERLDPAEERTVGAEGQGLLRVDGGEGDGQVRARREPGTAHDGAQVDPAVGQAAEDEGAGLDDDVVRLGQGLARCRGC